MPTSGEIKNEFASDYENVITTFYSDQIVNAIITLKVDTKEVDKIAEQIITFENVEDVYLVTGEVDLILKTRFSTYKALKDFIVGKLGPLEGIKDTTTMMIVTTFKESGMPKYE